jgi:UDP-GlcNAc:undecaprenyl-phosphate GlcNAc-1-phosphate transferase
MRILVDCRWLCVGGIGRATELLLRGLAEIRPADAWILWGPVAARALAWEGALYEPSRVSPRRLWGQAGWLHVPAHDVAICGITGAASDHLAVVLAGGLALALLGLVDDWVNLGAAPKVLVEATAGLGLWLAGIRAELFGVAVLDLPVTIAWVVVVTNAVNLLDNMDGLAAGIVAITATTLFALAAGRGDSLVATFSLAVAGASLGFLSHNFPPATIFLGDTGTLLLGFVLAAIALELDPGAPRGLDRVAIPVLAFAVPLFDTTLVVIDRMRAGRPVHVGGMDHTSHRLAALGLSTRGVAVVLYAVQLGCAALAVLVAYAPAELSGMVVVAAAGVFGVALVRLLVLPYAPRAGEATASASGATSLGYVLGAPGLGGTRAP